MATIRKRGEYQWETQVRKKGFPAQVKTFNTRSEAEAWAAVIESEMVRGVFVSRAEAERTTLGQIIDRYIEEVTPTHRGGGSESIRLKAMHRHPLALRFLASLSSTDFAKYRDERLKGNSEKKIKLVSPATVHRELGLFQQVVDQARREWGISLPENPLLLVSRPKFQNARNRRLGASEE
ncbi:MAG: Shufflon-specific DNA recombinase [Pseudomonadota bacterium]